MILNQIMSEPKKNHAPQHQKLKKKNSLYQLSESKTDQSNFVVQARS